MSAPIQPEFGSSLLKWLNSLYRPALPSGNRASPVPPLSEESDGASPSGKAVDFDSTIRRFESSRPSQPVRRLETLPPDLLEMPANCGVLRFNGRSPGTDLGHFRLGLADSLRRILEIFPFFGHRRRRPGSICTAWPSLQCNSPGRYTPAAGFSLDVTPHQAQLAPTSSPPSSALSLPRTTTTPARARCSRATSNPSSCLR